MAAEMFPYHGVPDEPAQSRMRVTYRFGSFMLDAPRRLLQSGAETVALPEKIFQVLVLLLEGGGAMVPKEKFFSAVWADDSVSDANLTQHIFMLRHILGERAREHTYILTVPGKGYRMAVPVETKLGLIMKGSCERCAALLPAESEAYICSYECTFCDQCKSALSSRCPNCSGELTRRPSRSQA